MKPVELRKTMEEFGKYQIFEGTRFDGIAHEFKFPNGYGASVVCFTGSYGCNQRLWELGVKLNGHLVYDAPITNDVIGYLTDEDVCETMKEIMMLPKPEE